MLAEEPETIEDVYEPFLLRLGFLDRTPQGRIATEARPRSTSRASGSRSRPARAEPTCRRCGTTPDPMTAMAVGRILSSSGVIVPGW